MGPGERMLNVHGGCCAAPWGPRRGLGGQKLAAAWLILIESDFKLQEFEA